VALYHWRSLELKNLNGLCAVHARRFVADKSDW